MELRYITGENLEPQITAKLRSLSYFPFVRNFTPNNGITLQVFYEGPAASVIASFADGPRIPLLDTKGKIINWCEGQLHFLNPGFNEINSLDSLLIEHYLRDAPKFTFTPNAKLGLNLHFR